MRTKLLALLVTLALIPNFLPVPVQAGPIEDAIDAGVDWLAGEQNSDGSWGKDILNPNNPNVKLWKNEYPVGETGLVVLKLEEYAFEDDISPLNPNYQYYDNVVAGLNYLFKNAVVDSNRVYFKSPASTYTAETYETAICMMAIAASRCPCGVVGVPVPGGSLVDTWTYRQVLCAAVNYLADGQCDSGNARGGWGYEPNAYEADNSVSGYAVTGLQYAENPLYGFCCEIPDFVKSELKDYWIDFIQYAADVTSPAYGGSSYDTAGTYATVTDPTNNVNLLKTGNLLNEMAFVDYPPNSTNVTAALAYIKSHWNDVNLDPGWGRSMSPAHYQAAYCLMRGLQSMSIADDGLKPTVDDWYLDLANVIKDQRNSNGSWPMGYTSVQKTSKHSSDYILSTVWALLTLERTAPPGPCKCEGWNPVTASWTEADGSPGIWTGKCGETITIASLSQTTKEIAVSTSENCSFGCAASENWTVTGSLGLVANGPGANAKFTPSGSGNYTVTFNATCGRASDNISCPSICNSTYCGSVSDNVSCDPCSVVITVGGTPPLCSCQGWNPVTVTWTDCNGIQGMTTGQCGSNPIIPQMECGTTVKVSSSENCSCLGVVTQVPASYEFQPNAIGLYPVTLTANCGDITCPPCNMGIKVRNWVKVEASIEVVTNSSLCPQLFTLTGKPDNMMSYIWTGPPGFPPAYGQILNINATKWPPGDYKYTLTVKDVDGCTDNETVALNVLGFPDCNGCNCESKLVIDIGWGNVPQKCIPQPCACIDILKPLYYFPMYCWPEENQPPPCPPPVINNFEANPAPSFGSACIPGAKWNLNWDVDVPYTQNVAWPASGNSTHPVYVEFHCKDSNNNVQTYWGPEAFEQDGFLTYALPADFQPCGKECEFCLWSYDCNLNKVMQCRPMCDNVTIILPCPAGCVCASPYWQDIVGKPLCAPCPCESVGPNMLKYCYGTSIGPEPPPPPPTACAENCDCLTEKEALNQGYTTLCQQEPCSAPGEPEKFCYSRCPEGCYCVTEKEADEQGYTISCSDEICDPTSKEAKYCFSPPMQPCSQRCQCLTQAQAKEYGLSDAKRCQTTPCQQDRQGKDMYCYPKSKAPLVDVTADRSFVTQGDPVRVCWKVTGEGITEVLFSAAGEKPTPVDPQGCKTFRPSQQTRYLVTAKSPAGSGQDSVTVGVGQPPPVEVCPNIISFTANCPPATGGKGEAVWYVQPCTVSWSVTGPAGTTVSISGIGNVGMSGSTQAQRDATYTLTARYGSCVRTAMVQVR